MWLTLYFYWTTLVQIVSDSSSTLHTVDSTSMGQVTYLFWTLVFLYVKWRQSKTDLMHATCLKTKWTWKGTFLLFKDNVMYSQKTTLEIEPSLELHVRFNLSYMKSGVGGVRHLIVYGFFKRSHFFSVCNSNSSLI